jgi:Type I phosphodiesterase / nucleotide pyrophosphatase
MGLSRRLNRRSRALRVLLGATVISVATWATSCTDNSPGPNPPSLTAWRGPACDLPPEWVDRIVRGTRTGESRGSDVIVVTRPPHYAGDATNTGHSGPADHLQEIPLILYGPGHVRRLGNVSQPATLASIAPTLARLLEFDIGKTAEPPLDRALLPGREPPRLVLTVVVDGGGRNVFARWPGAWPHIASLMSEGSSFVNATVGASPSITPASHTTIGTGVYPRKHGATAIVVRHDNGELTGAFTRVPHDPEPNIDPRVTLRHSTLAELYDRSEHNKPKVAMFGFGSFITGLIGRGAAFPGGDRDIAAFLDEDRWVTEHQFFALPRYVAGVDEKLNDDLENVDGIDGQRDGRWRGHDIAPLLATPAFSEMVRRAVTTVMRREQMGADDVPDLLFANLKTPDMAGHWWNMTSLEERDAIASVDHAVKKLTSAADRMVGRGNWVLVLTGDHGQTPISEESWPISMGQMRRDIQETLDHADNGRSLFEAGSQTLLFLDPAELAANDIEPEQVASFITEYSLEENLGRRSMPAAWEDRAEERLFSAAFPVRRLHEVVSCVRASKMPADGS